MLNKLIVCSIYIFSKANKISKATTESPLIKTTIASTNGFNMRSIAKHSLDLDLTDKDWFRYASFQGKSSLQADSVTRLQSLPALAVLSGWAEVFFALLVMAIALSSLYLVEHYPRGIAFLICLGSFLTVFIIKRLVTIKNYGFGSKKVMTISQNHIKIEELAKKVKKGGSELVNKSDISEVVFNYTYIRKNKHRVGGVANKTRAVLHTCDIHLNDGKTISLDSMRVGLFNVLYLLVFHQYPLKFRNTSAGGIGTMSIILLRLFALGAIGNALILLGNKLF